MTKATREVSDPAPRTRTRLGVVVVTLLAALGLSLVAAPAASASYTPDSYAARMGQLINETRVAHGLRPVTVTAGTSRVALGWALHLADQQSLSHNPRLAEQIAANGSPNWTVVSENVGSGYREDPDAVFAAYLNSPGHRRNILDARMRYVGLAAVFTGNHAWDVMNFVDSYGTPAAAPAPAPAPARKVAAPAPAVPQETKPVAQPVPQEVKAETRRAAAPRTVKAAKPAAKNRLTATRTAPSVRPRVADHASARPVAAPTAIFEQPLVALSLPTPAAPAGELPALAVGAAAGLLVLLTAGLTAAAHQRA